MKKIFIILGVIFVFLIIAGAIGFFVLGTAGSKLDKKSQAYIDEIVPLIVTSWDSRELIKRASPELLKVAPPEKMQPFFNTFAERLGPMIAYKGSKGESGIFYMAPYGKVITGTYVSEAIFEKAPATIHIKMILRNNQWQITEFRVNSDDLIP